MEFEYKALLSNYLLNQYFLINRDRSSKIISRIMTSGPGLLHIELNCSKRNALHCLPEISARAFNSSQIWQKLSIDWEFILIFKLPTNLLTAYGRTNEENPMVMIVRVLTKQDTSFEVKKISGIYSITFSSEKHAFSSLPLIWPKHGKIRLRWKKWKNNTLSWVAA